MYIMQIIGQVLLGIIILLIWIWGSLALYIAGPEPSWWRYILFILFAVSLPLTVVLDILFWQKLLLLSFVLIVHFSWWIPMKATNDKDWAPEVARIPYSVIENDTLVLHNVRNFSYMSRDEFTEHWETRRYPLAQLQTLDIFFSYWKSPHIAHIIMSWGFADGQFLAISIETRKDRTQGYSELKGFFKQFTLAYVAADEKDLIRLRTNYRKEQVYGYRIKNIPPQYRRYLLESYLTHMNKLVDEPEFYHALLQNCTSGVSRHYKTFMPNSSWFDWRLIANGHMDKLLYELGIIETTIPFEELRAVSRVDLRMQALDDDDFSNKLREGPGWTTGAKI